MPADLSEAGAQAASLALKMGSAAVDAITFMAGLGEELPVIEPVLKTLTAIREKVETVKSNREEAGGATGEVHLHHGMLRREVQAKS